MANVTLKDVAREAQVSHITVSRVINGSEAKYPVSEQTRQKVMSAAKKLSYKPNLFAKAMRTRQSGIIALVYAREEAEHMGSDMFYMSLQGSLERSLAKDGYNLLISPVSKNDIEQGALPMAVQRGLVEAAILVEVENHNFIRALKDHGVSVGLINRHVSIPDVLCVVQDNLIAFTNATEKLFEWGHQNLVLVTIDAENPVIEDREKGFRNALRKWGKEPNPELIIKADPWSDEAGLKAVELLKKHEDVTGFMCTTDGLAVSVIKSLKKHGYSIPDDVSVVGCGGHHFFLLQGFDLTTIKFDEIEMGKFAAKMIAKKCKNESYDSDLEFVSGEFISGSTAGPVKK